MFLVITHNVKIILPQLFILIVITLRVIVLDKSYDRIIFISDTSTRCVFLASITLLFSKSRVILAVYEQSHL